MSFSSMLASAAGAAAGAVAKAVAGGPSLPFETGEEVKSFAGKSCWKLHSGKKEDKATLAEATSEEKRAAKVGLSSKAARKDAKAYYTQEDKATKSEEAAEEKAASKVGLSAKAARKGVNVPTPLVTRVSFALCRARSSLVGGDFARAAAALDGR